MPIYKGCVHCASPYHGVAGITSLRQVVLSSSIVPVASLWVLYSHQVGVMAPRWSNLAGEWLALLEERWVSGQWRPLLGISPSAVEAHEATRGRCTRAKLMRCTSVPPHGTIRHMACGVSTIGLRCIFNASARSTGLPSRNMRYTFDINLLVFP